MYRVEIIGRLPGMNEYSSEQRKNPYAGAKMKQQGQAICASGIINCIGRIKIEKPVILHYSFYEKNKRRDLDNIAGFAHKVFQDALVECGVIKDDGWNNIKGFTDSFYVDRNYPRIVVFIEEVG